MNYSLSTTDGDDDDDGNENNTIVNNDFSVVGSLRILQYDTVSSCEWFPTMRKVHCLYIPGSGT